MPLDEPGSEVYETVKQLMKTQNLQGDPQDFIPAYKKELATVTTMRLKEVSPAVAQYVRAKKLAVRLSTDDTDREERQATQGPTRATGFSCTILVEGRVDRLPRGCDRGIAGADIQEG